MVSRYISPNFQSDWLICFQSHICKRQDFGYWSGKTQNQSTDKVFQYDPVTNQWTEKSPMPTARRGHTAVLSDGKVWAISAYPASSKVEIYDIASDSWSAGPDQSISRSQPVAWTENNKIFVASGSSSSGSTRPQLAYNPTSSQWSNAGSLPESKVAADLAVLDQMTYLVAGKRNGVDYSDKVFAADLIPTATSISARRMSQCKHQAAAATSRPPTSPPPLPSPSPRTNLSGPS